MERPVRKPNRLRGYDYSQQGCYFVTICTRGREHLLGHVAVGADVLIGPRVSLSKIGKTVETVIEKMPAVQKYVVMPNHVHILLQISAPEGGPMGTSAPTEQKKWERRRTSLPQKSFLRAQRQSKALDKAFLPTFFSKKVG